MLRRKLVFYKWDSPDGSVLFDPRASMNDLDRAIHGKDEFEILDSGDYKTAVLPVKFDDPDGPVHLRILSLRGGIQLPAKWSPDTPLEAINLLEGEYSADVTHVCIWPDNVAAQEFHHNAPRLGRLSFFLRKKLNQRVLFDGLYDPNMFERLDEIRGRVRSVNISLHKPDTWSQSERPGAFSTLFPAVAGRRTPSLRVAIGMGRYSRRDTFLDGDIEDAAFEIAEHAHDQVDSMIIGGINNRTNKLERIDLLNERVHVEIELPADALVPSVPDASRTFAEIEEARRSLDSANLIQRAIRAQAVRG